MIYACVRTFDVTVTIKYFFRVDLEIFVTCKKAKYIWATGGANNKERLFLRLQSPNEREPKSNHIWACIGRVHVTMLAATCKRSGGLQFAVWFSRIRNS